MEQRKIWIFSLDALGNIDAQNFEDLPGFRRLMDKGAYVPAMRGVYPTLTYPSHATIITGRPPRSHRIVNNRRLEPHRQKHSWFWYEADIVGDSLIRAGLRKGRKIGAFLWPVNAGAGIDANFAEIFPTQPKEKQSLLSLKNSRLSTILPIEWRYGKERQGARQPQLDNYVEKGCKYIIDKRDPDLLFVHFLDVDSHKHLFGADSPEVKEAIRRIDGRIQSVLSWRDSRPDRDRIDLVFLSDHSQINTPNYLYPLTDFAQAGWLVEEDQAVCSYDMVPHSAGGACYVYLQDCVLHNPDRVAEAKNFLRDYLGNKEGLEALYFQEDLEHFGADSQAFAMIEAKAGYAFSEYFAGTDRAHFEKKTHSANHGYHPDKELYDAIFFGLGPSFKEGYRKDQRGSLLDIAPTLARVQNLDLRDAQGRVMEELLR